MKSAYFRELQRYTEIEISNKLDISLLETVSLIRKLKSYGIVKSVKATSKDMIYDNLTNEDIELCDVDLKNPNQLFAFDYVGVITVDSFVIKCYPKYIESSLEPLNEMKQVLKVIREYFKKREQILSFAKGDEEQETFNMLAIAMFLIDDFCQYGAYSNPKDVTEMNGEGEIDWEKTVNETFPIISNNRPYHVELYTRNSAEDENNYFRRLHQCIVSECSKSLENSELVDLFDLEAIYPYEGYIHEFGDNDYVLRRLTHEMNVQFAERKQMLLKAMYAYISRRKTLNLDLGLSIYGTNSFNLVWEDVCSKVFDNQLRIKLTQLSMPTALKKGFLKEKDDTLLSLIEKPLWIYSGTEGTKKGHSAKGTLKPDLISFYEKSGELFFGIFDAKYYNIRLDETGVKAQPGVEDVSKQYLYQLAYDEFIKAHLFKDVTNAFLMPTEEEEALLNGEVDMGIFHNITAQELKNILVVKMPAAKMYDWYLKGIKIDICSELPFL